VTWIAVPLSIWLFLRRDLQEKERTVVVLLGTLALVWSVIAAALWTKLVLVPRYYLLPAVCISVLAGLALSRMWYDGRRRLACLLGFMLVASNFAALALDNRNYMIGEYKLVELASSQKDTIHTDAQTLRRAALLLEWAGVRGRVTAEPSHLGDLVFLNPLRAPSKPAPDWKLLYESPIPFSGGHLIACNLPRQLVPKSMEGSVGCNQSSLRLYRAGTKDAKI